MMVRKFVAICALVAVMPGCSMFSPSKQTLNITCNEPSVVVKVNGDRYDCPAKVDVRRDSKVIIEAKKQGYDSYSKLIDYHLSTSAKLDCVGTVVWFFPVFGLLSAGAWDLDQTDVSIQMSPM